MVLFEKNRGQAENLQEALAPLLNGRRRTTENRVLRDSFLVFFIRIHGIIFNKVSVEKISQYKTLALKGFEDLLQQRRSSSSPSDAATTTTTSTSPTNANENANEGISEPLLLKVFAINIYAIWSCMAECDIHPGDSYAEKMKKSVILRHAAKIAVEFFGRTVRACQSSKQFGDLPFLGPLSTFTDWLGGNIASVMPTSSQDKGPWHQMWKAFISFLNKLIDNDPSLRDCASLFEGEVRSGNEVLREEIEMRGFLPFQDIHKGVLNFSGIPLFDFSPYEVSEDEQIKGLRLKKLIHFGVKMSKSSEVQSIHYLEDKGMFSDRRASSMSGGGGGKKGVSGVGGEGGAGGGKKNKSRGRSVSTNGMDPNAAPINPYEGEQFLYGSPILSSPLGRGGGERGRGEEGSGEEEEEILFRPRVSPHLSGSYDSRLCFFYYYYFVLFFIFPIPFFFFSFSLSLFPFPFSLFPFPFSLFPFPFSLFPFSLSLFPFPLSPFPFPLSFPFLSFPFLFFLTNPLLTQATSLSVKIPLQAPSNPNICQPPPPPFLLLPPSLPPTLPLPCPTLLFLIFLILLLRVRGERITGDGGESLPLLLLLLLSHLLLRLLLVLRMNFLRGAFLLGHFNILPLHNSNKNKVTKTFLLPPFLAIFDPTLLLPLLLPPISFLLLLR